MKRIAFAALLIAIGTASHAARQDLDYERLRASLNALAADPVLGTLAPAERSLAEQAVQTLNDSSGGKGEHAHRLYIAERRVDIAYAAAQAVDAERRVEKLDRDHDRILLEASRREADNARMEAEKQRIQSMLQAEESDRLRAQGEENAQAAEAARAQAAQTQRLADAQAKEADLARKEAQLAELAAADLRGRLQNMRATRGAQGMQMTLDDIAFAPGRAALRPEAKASLGKLVAFVNRDTTKPIRIEGHTDGRGNANSNQLLSQRRADSVRDALIAAGVAANRMTSIGMGEDQPVADNETEEGRAKNRRVDVILEDQPR
jgi:outer membrane protein OmpA-like peptidoglycan-associated protein